MSSLISVNTTVQIFGHSGQAHILKGCLGHGSGLNSHCLHEVWKQLSSNKELGCYISISPSDLTKTIYHSTHSSRKADEKVIVDVSKIKRTDVVIYCTPLSMDGFYTGAETH